MTAAAPGLVLASASPRRRELLARLGLQPEVVPAEIDERVPDGEAPAVHVRRLAREKASSVAVRRPDAAVLAADTVVVVDGSVLGKPSDGEDAGRMLRMLSGRTHEVLTAVHVVWRNLEADRLVGARVTFAPVSEALIAWYVATGEPLDKAGAYAVQGSGALLVDRVEGNVQAVVGLPLAVLPALFAEVGLNLLPDGPVLRLSPRT